MFNSLLVIAALGGLFYSVKRWRSLADEQRASFAKKSALYGAAAVVLGLVLAGRAHWLMGILAALLALAGRAAQLAQYAPMFKKVFGDEDLTGGAGGHARAAQIDMSKQEAAEILGIDVSASVDEIRTAHKKLMQKIHPDRGGSDGLAKQINLAKDILLA